MIDFRDYLADRAGAAQEMFGRDWIDLTPSQEAEVYNAIDQEYADMYAQEDADRLYDQRREDEWA